MRTKMMNVWLAKFAFTLMAAVTVVSYVPSSSSFMGQRILSTASHSQLNTQENVGGMTIPLASLKMIATDVGLGQKSKRTREVSSERQ
jgi:hypothetical protein